MGHIHSQGGPTRRPLDLPWVPVVGSLLAQGQPQPGQWPSHAWPRPHVPPAHAPALVPLVALWQDDGAQALAIRLGFQPQPHHVLAV